MPFYPLDVERIERHRRIGAFRLHPELHAVLVGERADMRLILGRQRLEHAQYERRDARPDGQLDLRQPIPDRQAFDQPAQRHEHRGDSRGQNFAARHIGDIAALFLMEANQHAPLFGNMAHRQPCTIPVSPRRAMDRPEDSLRAKFR